jgi:hypothetical protein
MLGLLLAIVFIVVLTNIAASWAVTKWPRLRKR